MHRFLFSFIISFLLFNQVNAKNVVTKQDKAPGDSTYIYVSDDPILELMDSLVYSRYLQCLNFSTDTAVLNIYKYKSTDVPTFSDEVYLERINKLNSKSPFPYVYNKAVKEYIDVYAVRKRKLTSRVLGIAKLYFPMFEEVLDMYKMPLELKYLAIVESALNPFAVSRVGATGLWQFMYKTGKMYDLEVTSYVDDRYDPYKETMAACEFMQDLYNVYGDWALVLAAYNSGPGNVNKAIRRSGGKTSFWEIKQYLPKETQGYVPAFIAVSYVMNYAAEHNLYPLEPKLTYYHLDTLEIKKDLYFEQVSTVLKISQDDLRFLNPQYKRNFIPASEGTQKLILPIKLVGDFINNQENIYKIVTQEEKSRKQQLLAELEVTPGKPNAAGSEEAPEFIYHTVKKGGQSLSAVCTKYGCTAADIKEWNKLKSSNLFLGQKLKIYLNRTAADKGNKKGVSKLGMAPTVADSALRKKDSIKGITPSLPKLTTNEGQKRKDSLINAAATYKKPIAKPMVVVKPTEKEAAKPVAPKKETPAPKKEQPKKETPAPKAKEPVRTAKEIAKEKQAKNAKEVAATKEKDKKAAAKESAKKPAKKEPAAKSYTIQKGDNLWKIASKNSTTVEDLQKANNLKKSYNLVPGDKIKIPKK